MIVYKAGMYKIVWRRWLKEWRIYGPTVENGPTGYPSITIRRSRKLTELANVEGIYRVLSIISEGYNE